MKVEILKENLKRGVGIAERVGGKNLSLPILDNILLDAHDNFVSVVATDLETAVKVWTLGKILDEGRVVVPAKLVSGFISSLPNEKITIEEKGQNLYIECGSVKTQVRGHNPEDFPLIPEFQEKEFLTLSATKLHQALVQVIDIAASSQSRPEISGIYFSFTDNSLTLAATDSFRLGEKRVGLDSSLKKEYRFILPQKPAREVVNMLADKDGIVRIYIANNQVLFEVPMKDVEHPQAQIISRLIDGEYPNYQDIIPDKFKTRAILKREELLGQIKTSSLFSGKINEVRIALDPKKNEAAVSSQSADLGEYTSRVPGKVEGELVEVSFNYKFLVEGLSYVKSSEITFEVSREDGPCVMRPVGDASYLYVVMPIKLM